MCFAEVRGQSKRCSPRLVNPLLARAETREKARRAREMRVPSAWVGNERLTTMGEVKGASNKGKTFQATKQEEKGENFFFFFGKAGIGTQAPRGGKRGGRNNWTLSHLLIVGRARSRDQGMSSLRACPVRVWPEQKIESGRRAARIERSKRTETGRHGKQASKHWRHEASALG